MLLRSYYFVYICDILFSSFSIFCTVLYCHLCLLVPLFFLHILFGLLNAEVKIYTAKIRDYLVLFYLGE